MSARSKATAPTCAHEKIVRVVRDGEELEICRACHLVPGVYATSRWVLQDDPVDGDCLTPWQFDPGAAMCFKAPMFDHWRTPPFLVPTVDPATLPFDRNAKLGDRVAFLASLGFLQWIEGVVVAVGEDSNGVRGIVAVTLSGLTLRGNERVYAGYAGGLPFWGVDFFGHEENAAAVVAAHREAYPGVPA